MAYPPFYSTYPPGFGVYGVEGEAPAQIEPESPTGSVGTPSGELGCPPMQCPIIFGVQGIRNPVTCQCETPSGMSGRRRRRPRYVGRKARRIAKRRGRYMRASRYGQQPVTSEPALMSLGLAVGLGFVVGKL